MGRKRRGINEPNEQAENEDGQGADSTNANARSTATDATSQGLIEMMRIMQQHQHANMTQMQAFQMEILRMNEIQMEKTNILIEALASKPVTAVRACESEVNAGSSINTDEQETVPLSEPMQRYLGPKLYDLPEFDGSPEAWPMFKETFAMTTNEYGYSERQNLIRLQKAIKGKAREVVECLLIHSRNVPVIMDALKQNFGRPEKLIKSQIARVRKSPVIKEGMLPELLDYRNKVQNLTSFLEAADGDRYLENPTLMEELVSKLPPQQRLEWARYRRDCKSHENIKDFSKWFQVSLMNERLAEELGLKGPKENLTLQWFGNRKVSESTSRFDIGISGCQKEAIYTLKSVRTIKNLQLPLQTVNIEELRSKYRHLGTIPLQSYARAVPEILIGLDNAHLGVPESSRSIAFDGPIVATTKLGWVCYGKCPHGNSHEGTGISLISSEKDLIIDKLIEDYIVDSEMGVRESAVNHKGLEEERSLKLLQETTKKLTRVMAWILRISNRQNERCSYLQASEIEYAELVVCRKVQMAEYTEEIETLASGYPVKKSSKIWKLCPILDTNGLLRMNSRIQNADAVHDDTKRPIIMPQRHFVTSLIVDQYHKDWKHQNENTILAEIRRRFWIPHCREQTQHPDEEAYQPTMKTWRTVQQLTHCFWKKWLNEYLPELRRRTKWYQEVKPLAVGDLVLICDGTAHRSTWKKGRVTDVIRGKDGQVRAATVKTATGVSRRPACVLAKLDLSESRPC
ncbi:hypothetical protein ACLKA7_012251 [Drosophila subpalustris]